MAATSAAVELLVLPVPVSECEPHPFCRSGNKKTKKKIALHLHLHPDPAGCASSSQLHNRLFPSQAAERLSGRMIWQHCSLSFEVHAG